MAKVKFPRVVSAAQYFLGHILWSDAQSFLNKGFEKEGVDPEDRPKASYFSPTEVSWKSDERNAVKFTECIVVKFTDSRTSASMSFYMMRGNFSKNFVWDFLWFEVKNYSKPGRPPVSYSVSRSFEPQLWSDSEYKQWLTFLDGLIRHSSTKLSQP